ncbi:hypothetical protein ACFXGA_36580 [Actinosynnema sp. NPDC059335]|uniref:hypothetical protein n=1 Tax=Actinosynnema sp. NPDC059335 TaxID=3346804 RepID=UPI00366C07A4
MAAGAVAAAGRVSAAERASAAGVAAGTGLRTPAAVRFLGHLVAALVGVAFLGRDLEH